MPKPHRNKLKSTSFSPDGTGSPPQDRLNYKPGNERQKTLAKSWPSHDLHLILLVGEAGTGKTHSAVFHSLDDLMRSKIQKIMVGRPLVEVQEKVGFLPGDMDEKLGPWLKAFEDVAGPMWATMRHRYADRIESVAVGMSRGRTIKDAVMLIDEAQNLSSRQLKMLASRCGSGGKLILSGDPTQSDLPYGPCPLLEFIERVEGDEGCEVIRFLPQDQMRSEFVQRIVKKLKGFGDR